MDLKEESRGSRNQLGKSFPPFQGSVSKVSTSVDILAWTHTLRESQERLLLRSSRAPVRQAGGLTKKWGTRPDKSKNQQTLADSCFSCKY